MVVYLWQNSKITDLSVRSNMNLSSDRNKRNQEVSEGVGESMRVEP